MAFQMMNGIARFASRFKKQEKEFVRNREEDRS